MTASTRGLVVHGPTFTDGLDLGPTRIEIAEGRITSVKPGGSEAGADVLVRAGAITPGLIDLQVNGAGGEDFTSAADPDAAVGRVAALLARHGVTAFCPTVVSADTETIQSRLEVLAPRLPASGAETLGMHQEGPFISAEKRGVHDPAHLRLPSEREIATWLLRGRPAIVTLAPELPGALSAIRQLTEAGVVVSLGHSSASLAEGRAGLAAGARMGTHLFNAMPPLHHRHPGLVGALLEGQAIVGLIVDGLHVDPVLVNLVTRAVGPERVALVSDALAPAGLPPGPGVLGEQRVVSDGRLVRRVDGTIAGSVALLDAGVRNVVRWLPWLPPARVVQMATQTPASALGAGVARRKGRIAAGFDADLTVFSPDWQVAGVLLRGEWIDVLATAAEATA